MQAVVKLSVSYGAVGAGDGTIVEDNEGQDLTSLPLMGQDVSPLQSPQTYPIRVLPSSPNTSYERVLRFLVSDMGTPASASISNFRIWATNANPSANCTLLYKTVQTYTQPVGGSTSEIGQGDLVSYTTIPTSSPENPNITIGGSTTNSITTADSYTDFVYLTLHVQASQTAGGTTTISVSYDETV